MQLLEAGPASGQERDQLAVENQPPVSQRLGERVQLGEALRVVALSPSENAQAAAVQEGEAPVAVPLELERVRGLVCGHLPGQLCQHRLELPRHRLVRLGV